MHHMQQRGRIELARHTGGGGLFCKVLADASEVSDSQ